MAKDKHPAMPSSRAASSGATGDTASNPPPGSQSEDEALREMMAADESGNAGSSKPQGADNAPAPDASGQGESGKADSSQPQTGNEGAPAADTAGQGTAPDGGKPSSVETFTKLGQDSDKPKEKSDDEIAAELQAIMAARLSGHAAPDTTGIAEELVIVTVPKSFFLRLDNHLLVAIKAGTQRLPRSQAEHPYSKANGVKLFDEVPDDVYDEAAADIVANAMELEYAVTGISRHFKADAEKVRNELAARVDKLKGGAPK